MELPQAHDPLYQAYLVRLWRDRTSAPWRVSVQDVDDQVQVHFNSVAEFVAFLEQMTVQESELE